MDETKVYAVATAHLDTVWRWNLATSIKEYLLDTISKNFYLFEKYPSYKFNFEGAYRYELIEEYYPDLFEKVKEYVKDGRWNVCGSAYENGDVNIPSPEALFRNILLGNGYFKEKFGKVSKDIYLPDCFGFGYALPSVMKHANLNGFITQKLSWGGAYGRPFDIGIWQGVDGSQVYASIDARSYCHKFQDVRTDSDICEKIANNTMKYNLPTTLQFYGVGDKGGAPTEESVAAIEKAVSENSTNNLKVISATADDMFDDFDKMSNEDKAKLPVWNNELVMTNHGAGGYTSRTMGKRLNRQNEILADMAERSLVAADCLTAYKYPKGNLNNAWKRVIKHQFHDDIPGTSITEVYNDSWNDYFTSLIQFRTEYEGAVGAIANELDTSFVEETAIIVNNPVASHRKEAVKAHIRINHNAPYIKVFDCNGNEVPSETLSKEGKEFDIVFLADVEPLSYTVYDARASVTKCDIKTDLVVTEHSLQNSKYFVRFNKNGDIGSIFDKELNKEILESPIKMELLHDVGALNYPSWETRKSDIDSMPYAWANTPTFEIAQSSGAEIAIKITRELDYSTITQTVSLSSESKTIRVHNDVDWRSRRSMLKASFPFAVYNNTATYDLGLGAIKRGNNTENLYEVPAQKWADISDKDKSSGVTVFSDSKYGWDKPADNTLRLTCIHTPTGAFIKEARQDLQDIGKNIFDFGVYSHNGEFENGSQINAEKFNYPLIAFQTSSKREGSLGKTFSFGSISSNNVMLRAIKKSEDETGIVLRFNEGVGKEQKDITFSAYTDIVAAKEILASEEIINDAKVKDGKLVFSLKPFEVKSFLVTLKDSKKSAAEKFKKMDLEFNADGITDNLHRQEVILAGSGCSLPAELFPASVTCGGITFKLGDKNTPKNVLVPRGQTIELPKGMTKLYILAASVMDDREADFFVDNKKKTLNIYSMLEPIGLWDMEALNQKANVKNDAVVGIQFTHTHHPEDDKYNEKATFFMYEIDIRNGNTLTLPEDNRIVILAMSAVKKFSNTKIATEVIDKSEDTFYDENIAPIDKILDKCDFATIRAGKIQDQQLGGKGQGFKRDNIITNIIRSYTKSEW